jgi:hypothetical protein
LRATTVSRRIVRCAAAVALLICASGLNLRFAAAAAAPVGKAINEYAEFGYDMARVAAVLRALKQAAASMTPGPIEPYIEYPFTARHPGGGNIVIRSAADLRRVFPRIFNNHVRSAILSQKLDQAFHNYQGVMIGDGEVWIAQVCDDPACRNSRYLIRAINF